MERDFKETQKGVERDCKETQMGMERGCKETQKRMERDCKETQKGMERGCKETQKRMERDCKETQKGMERDRKETQKGVKRDCKETQRWMERDRKETQKGMERDCKETQRWMERDRKETQKGMERDRKETQKRMERDCKETQKGVKRDCKETQKGVKRDCSVLAVSVSIPENTVVAKAGASAILPCTYSTTVGSHFMVEWKFAPGNTPPTSGKQIYYYSDGSSYKPGSQASRLSVVQNPPTTGTASIQLNDISWSDNGSYICGVNNPPDFSGTGSGVVQLSVMVPPSSPSCQITGNSIMGQDATLTCSSVANPPATYTWALEGSKTPLLAGMMANQVTGSLLLTNLSAPMSGTYLCTASNELGQSSCQVRLTVSETAEAGAVAGAVVGVLLALILIAAIAFYFLSYRKKRKDIPKPDYPGNEIREDAISPMVTEEQRKSVHSSHSRESRGRQQSRIV
ncbi:V-set and immunoglobulin domain-containing protein 2 [Gastrophryne carolinensis]